MIVGLGYFADGVLSRILTIRAQERIANGWECGIHLGGVEREFEACADVSVGSGMIILDWEIIFEDSRVELNCSQFGKDTSPRMLVVLF